MTYTDRSQLGETGLIDPGGGKWVQGKKVV